MERAVCTASKNDELLFSLNNFPGNKPGNTKGSKLIKFA
jgi:hypothetical protein